MKIFIILFLLLPAALSAQQVYELIPGTIENSLTITLSNISPGTAAQNVHVRLIKSSPSLHFKLNDQILNNVEPGKQTDITFNFDVKRTADISKTDTVEFFISDASGYHISKQFFFSYIAPKEYLLEQNFPNPFNPSTTIRYQLPYESKVTLKFYNILGRESGTIVDEVQPAGFKEVFFNGESLASGVYVYRLIAESIQGKYSSTKKMMLVK